MISNRPNTKRGWKVRINDFDIKVIVVKQLLSLLIDMMSASIRGAFLLKKPDALEATCRNYDYCVTLYS